MAVVYSNAMKTARSQVVIDALGTAAVLVIGTSALAGGATGVLASIPLANPPFTNTVGVMTMASPPRTTAATGAGNAAKAELRHSDGTVVMSGLVVATAPGVGVDVVINALTISVGQTVQATVGTITPTS